MVKAWFEHGLTFTTFIWHRNCLGWPKFAGAQLKFLQTISRLSPGPIFGLHFWRLFFFPPAWWPDLPTSLVYWIINPVYTCKFEQHDFYTFFNVVWYFVLDKLVHRSGSVATWTLWYDSGLGSNCVLYLWLSMWVIWVVIPHQMTPPLCAGQH